MRVVVDTNIWSFALRRGKGGRSAGEERAVEEWSSLVREKRAILCGPVRQEVLAGIREERQFERLRTALRAFPDEVLHEEDFEEAAACLTRLRRAGVSVSPVDALLCSVARRRKVSVFSADPDFARCSRVLGVQLHTPR
ncbi:MAG: PIN domain-containing protein [Planctomycetes bacterium]|nr:PIN domain-containing protein [Planctomycetota bacterium]